MLSITDIKAQLKNCKTDELDAFINEHISDERKGVQALVNSAIRSKKAYEAEVERIRLISQYENNYRQKGYSFVAGIDEVGRGPLAGPVVAACVILPENVTITGINDSKKLSLKKREELYDIIYEKALSIGIGIADNNVIDSINILQATFLAMREAIEKSNIKPDFILADGNFQIPSINIPQEAIVKGDSKSISIGAASIIAKVTRDRMMVDYSKEYPQYGFESNVGYGSQKHIEAIKKYGLSPLHRRSFTGNFIWITN